MEKWEKYVYGFSGAVLTAMGSLFIILGIGSLFLSFAAFLMVIKKRSGFKLF